MPDEGVSLGIAADRTLMEAMRAAGLPLRHACRNGVCEVCAARLYRGRVEQSYPTAFIEGSETDAPLILLCTSRARSDLVLGLTRYARARPEARALPETGTLSEKGSETDV